ncbi:hypothetical protein [Actinomycetospora termitidis]|uniref:Glycosyl transferase n=1 Tax=Actinomycetospora termitidis TaxID=3053470 RepID=A0ABT7MG47_9PSEU|nr:hypothetical protein [Actinomycetospora sp. Odt1-22]MDL5158937.1 hypothetical protein [Actinomycetospora sp. Odt1-22]
MEIIRSLWAPYLDVVLVHADNGPHHWEPYLEDHTVKPLPAESHFTGAASLIDAGTSALRSLDPVPRFVVCLAGDCWLYRPEVLRDLLDEMAADDLRLAAARFEVARDAHGVVRQSGDPTLLPGVGLTTDFFVLDLEWAIRTDMIPLRFDEFLAAHGPLLDYLQEIVLLEKFFEGRFLGAVRLEMQRARWWKDGLGSEGLRQARRSLRVLDERPIDPTGRTAPPHKGHWPALGLSTTEDPTRKRDELRGVDDLRCGPTLRRFFAEDDLSWFNAKTG